METFEGRMKETKRDRDSTTRTEIESENVPMHVACILHPSKQSDEHFIEGKERINILD